MESNYSIYQVLGRYNIACNNGLRFSYEQLSRAGVNTDFITALLKVFEDESRFNAADFDKFSLDVIIDYVKRTHQYYLQKKLQEIEQSIHLLLQDYSDRHPLLYILYSFYADYKVELAEHIAGEENELLPYIAFLQQCCRQFPGTTRFFEKTRAYSIQKHVEEHTETRWTIQEVKSAILTYKAPATNTTPYRILLLQLDSFERDLEIHGLIEDHVLVPRARQLEAALQQQFLLKTAMN